MQYSDESLAILYDVVIRRGVIQTRMQYKCSDLFMIRVPSFPVNVIDDLEKVDDWSAKELLSSKYNSDVFKEAVEVSSPSLLESMEKLSNSLKKQRKLSMSMLKYLDRASTRPTPYGMFAGVSLGKFGEKTDIEVESNRFIRDARPDMEWIFEVQQLLEKQEHILPYLRVMFNPLCKVSGDRVLNAYYCKHGVTKNREVSQRDIRYTRVIDFIRKKAESFIDVSNLISQIECLYPDVGREKIIRLIKQLMENEFLFSNLRTPAYCSDPLGHLTSVLRKIPSSHKDVSELEEISEIFNRYNIAEISEAERIVILKNIRKHMREYCSCENYLAVDKIIELNRNTLKLAIKQKVEKFADTLSEIAVMASDNDSLGVLKREFLEKYGYDVRVPVLDVLDINDFDGLRFLSRSETTESKREKMIKAIVDDKIQTALRDNDEEVQLYKEDFVIVQSLKSKLRPAISFDVNFQIAEVSKDSEKKNVITVAPNGGAINGGSMIQRFDRKLNQEDLHKYNELYDDEKKAIDGSYLLAEVRDYSTNGRVFNIINHTKQVPYYIAIGCSGADEKGELPVSDLSIGIGTDEQFYIYSEKLQKRIKVISNNMANDALMSPILFLLKKISNNYESQPVARLFAITSNTYTFQPRVYLEDIIISPKKWNLSFTDSDLKDAVSFTKQLKNYADQYALDKEVVAYQGDNRLVIDISTTWGRQILYEFARKDKLLLLTEVTDGLKQNQIVRDQLNRMYTAEFTMTFCLSDYRKSQPVDVVGASTKLLQTKERVRIPGAEGWLYLKLYGASIRQNVILRSELEELLSDIGAPKWFFIRYSDNGPHIRLRIKFEDENTMNRYIGRVFRWISEIYQRGYISNAAIDTYQRESNRYGGEQVIDVIEDCFWADSVFVSEILKENTLNTDEEIDTYYLLGIISTLLSLTDSMEEALEMLQAIDPSSEDNLVIHKDKSRFLSLIEQIESGEVDSNTLKSDLMIVAYENRLKKLSVLKESLNKTELTNSIQNIIRSLTHMYCNRLTGDRDIESRNMRITKAAFTMYIKRAKYLRK